jgi:hypothetical protein
VRRWGLLSSIRSPRRGALPRRGDHGHGTAVAPCPRVAREEGEGTDCGPCWSAGERKEEAAVVAELAGWASPRRNEEGEEKGERQR